MKKTKTYNVQIWCGLRDGYTDNVYELDDARRIVDKYIKDVDGDCVTITPTEYRYKNGCENGFAVSWINYPRSPSTAKELIDKALVLAQRLMVGLKQNRVSIVTQKDTFLLENKV